VTNNELNDQSVQWRVDVKENAARNLVEYGGLDVVVINNPFNLDVITLTISAFDEDGTVLYGDYRVDVHTGEVVIIGELGQRAATFSEQIERQASADGQDTRALMEALAQ